MSAYSDERRQAALQRVLVRQPVVRKTGSGEAASSGSFSRLYENASLLMTTRPQVVYQLTHLARNDTLARVSALAALIVETLVALCDATTPSRPVAETAGLDTAASGLRAATAVTNLGSSTTDVERALSKYSKGLSQFAEEELRPNLRQRVGTRDLTTMRVGSEALRTVVDKLAELDAQWVETFTALVYLRNAVPETDMGRLQRTASTMLLNRAQVGVEAARAYYRGRSAGDAEEASSTLALNLLAGHAAIRSANSGRAPATPKLRSQSLNQEEATAIPKNERPLLHVVGEVEPATIQGSSAPVSILPAGAQVSYQTSGGAVRTAAIPGAGLYSIVGVLDLSAVTIPTGSFLYVEIAGTVYPVPLTTGASSISQVVADIQAASLAVSASAFGQTGRLVLSSASPFNLLPSASGEVTPSLTSGPLTVPAPIAWGGTALEAVVVDSNGIHRQSHTFAAGFTPASVNDVINELIGGGFHMDGADTVLALTASGSSLVLSATEAGGSVSLTAVQEATAVTQGFVTWPTTVAVGRTVETSTTLGLLGLGTEATQETSLQEVLDAFTDAGGSVVAAVDSSGVLALTSTDMTVASSLEITGGVGLSALGLSVGLERGQAQTLEVRSRGATMSLLAHGLAADDVVQILDQGDEYEALVASTPTGTLLAVGSGIPANVDGVRFRILDKMTRPYDSLESELRTATIQMTRSRLPNVGALRLLVRKVRARASQPRLSPGEVKKFAAPLLDALTALHPNPDGAAELDDRLAEFGLSRAARPTEFHTVLSSYTTQSDPETVAAVDSMIRAFEERGYDRAAKMLLAGRVTAFMELTPATASESGNLKLAMRNVGMALKGPKSDEASAAAYTSAVLTTSGSDPSASPTGTDE